MLDFTFTSEVDLSSKYFQIRSQLRVTGAKMNWNPHKRLLLAWPEDVDVENRKLYAECLVLYGVFRSLLMQINFHRDKFIERIYRIPANSIVYNTCIGNRLKSDCLPLMVLENDINKLMKEIKKSKSAATFILFLFPFDFFVSI